MLLKGSEVCRIAPHPLGQGRDESGSIHDWDVLYKSNGTCRTINLLFNCLEEGTTPDLKTVTTAVNQSGVFILGVAFVLYKVLNFPANG